MKVNINKKKLVATLVTGMMLCSAVVVPTAQSEDILTTTGIVQTVEADATTNSVKTYSKSKNGNTYLSKNFQVKEFACKDGSDKILIDLDLVNYLQKIREHFGKSITINSGYRTPSYNKKVGGATNSYHTKGQAADIVVSGVSPKEVAKYAESIGIKGIGLYSSFVHIDTRTSKYFWNQTSGTASSVSTFGASAPISNTTTNNNSSSNKSNQVTTTTSSLMKVVTNSDNLNIRSGAGTSYSKITSAPKGAYVVFTGKSSNGWYQITYKGKTGWASKTYLAGIGSTKYKVNTNSTSLNMRVSASTSASKVTSVPKGATVYITKTSGNWAYGVYNGYTGWMSLSYLKKS